jgi:hypothetical protein
VILSELQPGTTYHYALVATNAAGTSTGQDATFTTQPPLPPLATTGESSSVTQTTATITGTVDTQGLPTSYEFELGTDTSYGTQMFGNAGGGRTETVTLTLTNLQPGTTYYYRLIATNADGTSYGAEQSFTTAAFPNSLTQPPNVPFIIFTNKFPSPTQVAKPPTKHKASSKCRRGFVHKRVHGKLQCVKQRKQSKAKTHK